MRSLHSAPVQAAALALLASLMGCSAGADDAQTSETESGSIEVSLSQAPADARCLRLDLQGSRSVTRLLPLSPGLRAAFQLDSLPLGALKVDAVAFERSCSELSGSAIPEWVTAGPVVTRIRASAVAQVVLKLLRNGRAEVGIEFEAPAWYSEERKATHLAIIGDTPYGAAQVADFPAFIESLNAAPNIDTIVHLGDIKNGSTRCDDAYFQSIADSFASLSDPLIYTPGDNEWTDCHRRNNGAYDPLERLSALRALFYPNPGLALGGGFKQVLSQAEFAGFETFVENQLWFEAGVAFAAVHVVGSNNSSVAWYGDDTTGTKLDEPARRNAERLARTEAAVDWIERTFDLAQADEAVAVVLSMQADMWDAFAAPEAFTAIIQTIADRTRGFGKPVLLLQGDSHVFIQDNPLLAGDPAHGVSEGVSNLTRIVVQGSNTAEWLLLRVDPAAAEPLSWERVLR